MADIFDQISVEAKQPMAPPVGDIFDTIAAEPTAPKSDPGVLDILKKRGSEVYQSLTRPFEDPVTTTVKALGGAGIATGGAVNDLLGLGLKKVADTSLGRELIEPFAQSGGALLRPLAKESAEFLKDKPQLSKDLQGLFDASGLLVGGQGLKTLAPAGKEAANITKDVGSRAVRAAGKVAAKVGPDPEGLIQSGAKWSTTLPPEEAKKLSRAVIDNKLTLNPAGYEKLESGIDVLNNEIKTALKPHAGKPIDAEAVAGRASEARKKAAGSYDAAGEVVKVDEEVQKFLGNWKGKLTVEKAQAIKQDIYKQLKNHYDSVRKGGPGLYADGEIAAKKNIARGLKEEIENAVPDANIKAINAKESELLNLEPHLRRAVGRIGNHNILSLDDVLATTAGTVLGGPVAGVAAGVAKRALGSPAMKSRLAMALDTLANPSAPPALKSEALRTAQAIMDATNPRAARAIAPSIDAPLSNPPVPSTAIRMSADDSAINKLLRMRDAKRAAHSAEVDRKMFMEENPPQASPASLAEDLINSAREQGLSYRLAKQPGEEATFAPVPSTDVRSGVMTVPSAYLLRLAEELKRRGGR